MMHGAYNVKVIKELTKTTKLSQICSVLQHLKSTYYAHLVLPFRFHIILAICLFRNSIKQNGSYVKQQTVNTREQGY